MLNSLLSPVTGLIVSASTGIALETAVKIITPPALGAVTSFAIKAGTTIGAGIIAGTVSRYVVGQLESVIETVKNTGADVETAQEDL